MRQLTTRVDALVQQKRIIKKQVINIESAKGNKELTEVLRGANEITSKNSKVLEELEDVMEDLQENQEGQKQIDELIRGTNERDFEDIESDPLMDEILSEVNQEMAKETKEKFKVEEPPAKAKDKARNEKLKKLIDLD
jgi:hypothetical protein